MIQETGSGHNPLSAPGRGLIAPAWHTVVVVLLFVGLAVAGAMNRGSSSLTAQSTARQQRRRRHATAKGSSFSLDWSEQRVGKRPAHA